MTAALDRGSMSLYPTIITQQDVNHQINKTINAQRAQKLLSIIQSKQEKLEHYNKIYKRWRNTHKAVNIVNLSLTSLIGGSVFVLGILTTNGIAIPVLVMGLLGGYTTFEGILLEGMNIGLVKKKVERFKTKIDIIKDGLNKMYYFYERARQDGEITVDEMEGFNKLMKELDDKLNSNEIVKVDTNDKLNYMELKKDAEIIAKKEVQEEIKIKLIKEAKQKLLSTAAVQ